MAGPQGRRRYDQERAPLSSHRGCDHGLLGARIQILEASRYEASFRKRSSIRRLLPRKDPTGIDAPSVHPHLGNNALAQTSSESPTVSHSAPLRHVLAPFPGSRWAQIIVSLRAPEARFQFEDTRNPYRPISVRRPEPIRGSPTAEDPCHSLGATGPSFCLGGLIRRFLRRRILSSLEDFFRHLALDGVFMVPRFGHFAPSTLPGSLGKSQNIESSAEGDGCSGDTCKLVASEEASSFYTVGE